MHKHAARSLRSGILLILATSGLLATIAAADPELDYGLAAHRLARVEISGNTLPDGELKKVLRLDEPDWRRPLAIARYQPELVDTQLQQLRNFYHRQGFHAATVTLDSVVTEADDGDVLYISVAEGPRTLIKLVVFTGEEPLRERDLRKVLTLREGDPSPADRNGFGEDIYGMRRLYWTRGYLQVEIQPELVIEPDGAVVTYVITPGPTYHVSRVTIVGSSATRRDLIAREVRLQPGDLFAWNEVDLTRQQLLGTALFRDVSLRAVAWDTLAHQAALEVRVSDRKPAYYELGVGLGSRERIRAMAAWGHNNLWGSGRRVSLRLRGYWNVEEIIGDARSFAEGDLNYRADVLYSNPHLLGRDYPLDINVFGKRETRGESALIQNSLGFLVGTQVRDDLRWTNRLDFRLRVVDPEVHPLAPDSLQSEFEAAGVTLSQTRSLIHSLFSESRDNVFNPRRGHYFTSQLEVAGGLMGGDNSFLKWSGSLQVYRPVLGGVLAGRVRVGAVRPYGGSRERGSDGVPYDDRYFAGGAYSVRGYRDNGLGPQITDAGEVDQIGWGSDAPLPDDPARGGNYQLITNLEWRFPLPLLNRWNFSSVLFLDGGNVWENVDDIRLKAFRWRSVPGEGDDPASTKIWDYRYSVGTGLRFDTPFGPFRLDVGFPLKRARYQSLARTVEDDRWRAHFSLGHVF
ncbi:MAG: BamA/TamA family outer membrane protein [Candidatus Krumholzibacteriia bacterium]